ncbi:MAG: 2-oxoacid:acceptor oxidoreductase family protein [Candidatus Odinarchaeum yellowstonii]|uniref:pyruvate synthase n=1 Tax=Odinarchaeota yellowstonii (strain LCB_4) TaxID=1841599 RepID=A0AAF0D1N8_ODILC|nr:MAG: 2-oxoacid:acceptor oxidoreductase family protein [Candidatus Odinarchaeum yellowstonii]
MNKIIEIRFHGRGGQGAWTATQLLAMSALEEGKYAQSFPSFGPERAGAPMMAFVRISDQPIKLHSDIYNPHSVVVLDPTLLTAVNVLEGMQPEGKLVVNSHEDASTLKSKLKLKDEQELWVVPASDIALEILGRDITSTAMIGALVKATGYVNLDSVLKQVQKRFSGAIGEKNIVLIKRSYEEAKKV